MKKLKDFSRVCCQVFLLVALLVTSGCSKDAVNDKPIGKVSYSYFDTVSYVYDYSNDSEKEFDDYSSEVFTLLGYYHELFDIYNDYEDVNNIKTINDNAGKSAVKVDKELIDFLLYCKNIYQLTDGQTNIMMGSVLKLWHDCRQEASSDPENATIPTIDELNDANLHTSIDNLIIDEEQSTVYIADSLASIDVGAIGKGYATQKAADYLRENGKNGYVLNIGGNISIIGNKPNGDKWVTGITNPFESGGDFPIKISISDTSCVTSGVYERYYVVDGVRYHHIIDKETLMPADYFVSVTVICKDSGLADSLSTALFCCDEQTGREMVDKIGDVGVIWIYSNGKIEYTDNVENLIIDK